MANVTRNSLTDLLAEELSDEEIAEYFDPRERPRPTRPGRPNRHKNKPAAIRAALEAHESLVPQRSGLALSAGLDVTSAERAWIAEHLGRFQDAGIITAVLRRVKGGKEANVYCCAAHPAAGVEFIAAKLYRPRLLRNLRNDAIYRQGRPVLAAGGHAVDPRDWRLRKALDKGTRTGREAQQTSWVEYEFQTMQRLYQAGADVPRPVRHGENAILMEFLGVAAMPAPALSQIRVEPDEAHALYQRLMRNVEIMLAQQCVHGDLSAYNVLYWEGEVKIIDFPQVVDPRQNPDAYGIFRRDVERIGQYFARYGVHADPHRQARELWHRYIGPRLVGG